MVVHSGDWTQNISTVSIHAGENVYVKFGIFHTEPIADL